MTEHFIRHGDQLTLVTIVYDPVYLEESFVRTRTGPARTSTWISDGCSRSWTSGRHPAGYAPHYPFGTRQDGYAKKHGLPFEATQAKTPHPGDEQKVWQMLAVPAQEVAAGAR
jgi:hypothetical protein